MENDMSVRPFLADDGREYFVMHVHPVQAAALHAMERFAGRDRRRVKREMNKAMKRATAKLRKVVQ